MNLLRYIILILTLDCYLIESMGYDVRIHNGAKSYNGVKIYNSVKSITVSNLERCQIYNGLLNFNGTHKILISVRFLYTLHGVRICRHARKVQELPAAEVQAGRASATYLLHKFPVYRAVESWGHVIINYHPSEFVYSSATYFPFFPSLHLT